MFEHCASLCQWLRDFWNDLDACRFRTGREWQFPTVITATAIAEDGCEPKEKPRPSADGQNITKPQTGNRSYTGGCCAHERYEA